MYKLQHLKFQTNVFVSHKTFSPCTSTLVDYKCCIDWKKKTRILVLVFDLVYGYTYVLFFVFFVLRIDWKIGHSSNTSEMYYPSLHLPVYVVICVTGSSTSFSEMRSEPGSRRRWSDDTIDDRSSDNISRAMRTGRIDNEMTVEKSKGERNICFA